MDFWGQNPTHHVLKHLRHGHLQIEFWQYVLADFFFRPSPSWLSPGRSTVRPCISELCRNMLSLLIGSIKREHGPLHSPVAAHRRCYKHKREKQTQPQDPKHHKQKQPQSKQNKNHKKASEKHRHIGQNSSIQIQSSLCSEEIGPCVKQRTSAKRHW